MPIEDELNEFNISQKTELEGVADQLFNDKIDVKGQSSIDMKTNLEDDEIGLCMINDIIFREIDMPELSPTNQFKRLASSRKGWKTEAFVRTAQGTQELRSGGSVGERLKGLFTPR